MNDLKIPHLLSRRSLIVAAGVTAVGLVVAVNHRKFWSRPDNKKNLRFSPSAYLEMFPDGKIVVIVGQSELGQGIHTCLAQALADELDADWSTIMVRHSRSGQDPGKAFELPLFPGAGVQMIAESTSTKYFFEPMRIAGAAARLMLVRAASAAWGLREDQCRTSDGHILGPDGRKASYKEFVQAAANLPIPELKNVRLKSPRDFKFIGKSMPRVDVKDKVAGKPIYGIDFRLPGLLTAVVARSPVLGGRMISFDQSASLTVPGVKACLPIPTGVAVLANGFWAAKTGRDRLKIEWDHGPRATMSTEAMEAEYRRLLGTPGALVLERGNLAPVQAGNSRDRVAEYSVPYLAHAAMEPLNCTMQWRADSCEIWVGTQYQSMDLKTASRVLGIPAGSITLNTLHSGGGFGRRASPKSDFVAETAEILKRVRHLNAPVQNIWGREDDLQGGEYRPMAFNRLAASLSPSGDLLSWSHRIVSQSILDDTEFVSWNVNGIDALSIGGADNMPYEVANFRLELHTPKTGPTVSWMRSVGEVNNAFAIECFIDELALLADSDPVAFRLKMLGTNPRLAHVLDLAAKRAGFHEKTPKGIGRGIAVHQYIDSRVAMVAEVSVEKGKPKATKFTVAIDCGRVVNPNGVKAQVEGGVMFALSSALYGKISFDHGRTKQKNFDTYRMLRIESAPEVVVHLVDSDEPPVGVGEVNVPPVAPALCNAIYAATGKRIRDLPVSASIDL
jgi:isoquinoline 1-oxidoreductase subunit beta